MSKRGKRISEKAARACSASNILGGVAFLAMVAVPAACEGGMYMTAAALTAAMAACTYLSIREDGKKR